jgi:hypothetical protein
LLVRTPGESIEVDKRLLSRTGKRPERCDPQASGAGFRSAIPSRPDGDATGCKAACAFVPVLF